jgi:hypothetical protein
LLNKSITFIISQTAIYDRSAIIKAGGYISDLGWTSDTFAAHVIAFRQGACYIPEILTMERRHPQQQGTKEVKQIGAQSAVIRSAIRILKKPGYSDVLPMFKRTAPFSIYPWEVLRVIVNDREFGYFSFKLLRFALLDKFVKRPLKQLAAMIRKKYRGWSVDAAFRYLPIVREIKRSGLRNPSILDVGSGSLGITPYLKMPVTGADISFDEPASDLLKPVKFDGHNLPFNDREFDFVVSVDMLEHVRPDQREHMIRELIRVTKRKLFLAAPLGKDSEEQDAGLDKIYKSIWGKSFQFLVEHVSNGLPTREWIDKTIPDLCRRIGRPVDIRSQKNLNLKFRYFVMRLSMSRNKLLNYLDNVIALLPFVRYFVNFGKCYRCIYTISFKFWR